MLSGLKSPNYQEPNLRETVSGEEERGNLMCVGAAWVQLGEGSCPQREIETSYFWACPPSVPSHTIMHHPRPSLSLLIHLSPPQQGPVVQLPSRPLNSQFHVLHWRMGAGRWVWVSDWATKQRIAEENGCIGCCPLISLVRNCVVVRGCSGRRRMRDEGVNCV